MTLEDDMAINVIARSLATKQSTIHQFITSLWTHFFADNPLSVGDLLRYAHTRGWIEDQDERFCDKNLNRQTAARILHQFMKIEMGLPDLKDIFAANLLADLYTCHTCVNHIAQVYLRGIMEAQTVERDGVEYKIFNHLEELSFEEVNTIIKRVSGALRGCPPLEGVAETGVVELVETTPVAARGRRPF